jgi:hypothetical protein
MHIPILSVEKGYGVFVFFEADLFHFFICNYFY